MPLPSAFPGLPESFTRRAPPPVESTMPSLETPSVRRMIPLSEPLLPEPYPTPTSQPVPSGFDAPLFQCHCTPKCIEFLKPQEHPELRWINSSNQPLRTRVVASGPTSGRHTKTKTADFDVDSRVAYEFNDVGFYEEMLTALKANYVALLESNERSQAFLYHNRSQAPAVDLLAPRIYKPYYPTQHLVGQSFVAPAPLRDASRVAAQVQAPTIVTATGGSIDSNGVATGSITSRSVDEIEAELRQQAQAIASSSSSGSLLPPHLRDLTQTTRSYGQPNYATRPVSSVSASPAAQESAQASRRAKLAAERAQFAQEMKEQLLGKMSIAVAPKEQS